jgi:hypothetical protein
VAAKKRAPKNVELIYKLDGNLKEVDVFRLAPALLAAGHVIQEAHKDLGAPHEIGVNVKPFGEGSFVVDIVLVVKSNWPLVAASATLVDQAPTKYE